VEKTTNIFTFVIPARIASSRFPGKVLRELAGKPVLDWVHDNCRRSRFCREVIVGTDSPEIMRHGETRGWTVEWTKEHNCCSNRTAEVASRASWDLVVEVQSDEPFLWASLVDSWLEAAVSMLHRNPQADLIISACKLAPSNAMNPHFVKIVQSRDERLLWVSRSAIPCAFKGPPNHYLRHAGLYLWRRSALLRFAALPPGQVEIVEDTHAVRLVENAFCAQVALIPSTQSIDLPSDLEAAESYAQMHPEIIQREAGYQLAKAKRP